MKYSNLDTEEGFVNANMPVVANIPVVANMPVVANGANDVEFVGDNGGDITDL